MDLIFSTNRRQSKHISAFDSVPENVVKCCLSSTNVVAFSTIVELDDITLQSWGAHVYIADLNSPWHCHKVLSSASSISVLQWDLTGDLLLVADSGGTVRMYKAKDHLLNDWQLAFTTSLPGEYILAAAFFHSGKKVCWNSEKKDSSSYAEKFQHVRFACSVKQFGARPAAGALLLTTTGMLASILLPHVTSQTPLILTTESLAATRIHIKTADICYGKNGHFLLAVSSGNAKTSIQCYKVSVKKQDDKCVITSHSLPSFFLSEADNKDVITTNTEVTHLRWVVREDADALVVAATGNNPTLQVWELREKSIPVHPVLGGTEPFNTVVWQFQSHFRHKGKVVSLATSKLTVSNNVSAAGYVIAALSDNTVHCLYRDSLKLVATASLPPPFRHPDEPSPKYTRQNRFIAYIDMSWLGNVLLLIDNQSQLHLYKLPPVVEPSTPMSVPYATTLLEYCLVTGLDWLDLMLVLRPGMLDALCDRLTESFNRQNSAVQQYYYVQFLCIKTSLYRLSPQGQNRANDLTNLLMLHSIATAFKSLLRPSDLSIHDKSPADSLATVMSEGQNDVDKVLMHLEAKEFTVEPSTLQSLQQLIQWVADLALNLLGSKLPDCRPSVGKSYELIRDVKALNTLRELLVLIRIWGLLRPSCLPYFVRSAESLDVLGLLFRLLSRLVQNPTEPDEALIDECCLLPSQVLIPQLQQSANRLVLASPQVTQLILPLQLEYLTEPDILCPSNESTAGQTIDCVRHLYLGSVPKSVKQCVRCGGSAGTQPVTRTAAIRAWDQRWLRSCQCGGLWSGVKTGS